MLTVGEASREIEQRFGISVAPRTLSDMLYRRALDAKRCPLQAGRRMIPADYLASIASILRREERRG